jgi:hypothetical protein
VRRQRSRRRLHASVQFVSDNVRSVNAGADIRVVLSELSGESEFTAQRLWTVNYDTYGRAVVGAVKIRADTCRTFPTQEGK